MVNIIKKFTKKNSQKNFTKNFIKIFYRLTEIETQMRLTLANNLAKSVQGAKAFKEGSVECEPFIQWVDSYQVQIVTLAAQVNIIKKFTKKFRKKFHENKFMKKFHKKFQISWSEDVEAALSSNPKALKDVLTRVEDMLKLIADLVLQNQPPLRRKKLEHLIYEYIHRRYSKIYKKLLF